MTAAETQGGGGSPVDGGVRALLESLRGVLSEAPVSERYRVLAALFNELAEQFASGDTEERETGEGGGAASVARKTQDLQRENAGLQDRLKTTQADLARREKQLEAEAVRGRELAASIEEHRQRIDDLQKEMEDVHAQLVARNNDIHQLEVERDDLRLSLQRAELRVSDRSQVDSLEEGRRELAGEIGALRTQIEQLRADKDAEIDALRAKLRDSAALSSQSADALLMHLWDRLASTKPASLAQGGVQPTVQAAEHLVDSFVELAQFVHGLDQDMRVFLNRYTRNHPTISRQWQVYAARDDFNQTIEQTIAPQTPRQVGVFRLKLKAFHKFMFAAMVSSDAVIESIASELNGHLMGDLGAGSDANQKTRDYVRNDGPELFMDYIKKLRSEKLGEVFIRG